jgi:hypothetical protein
MLFCFLYSPNLIDSLSFVGISIKQALHPVSQFLIYETSKSFVYFLKIHLFFSGVYLINEVHAANLQGYDSHTKQVRVELIIVFSLIGVGAV